MNTNDKPEEQQMHPDEEQRRLHAVLAVMHLMGMFTPAERLRIDPFIWLIFQQSFGWTKERLDREIEDAFAAAAQSEGFMSYWFNRDRSSQYEWISGNSPALDEPG